jgi:hypothetical protein
MQKLTRSLLSGNALLWLVFWGIFFSSSRSVVPTWPPSDGIMVLGRSCDLLAPTNPHHWLTYLVFWPSAPTWLIASPIFRMILDFYHLGMNLSGTRLVVVCVASFLQWYLIGRLLSWLMGRRQQHIAAAA